VLRDAEAIIAMHWQEIEALAAALAERGSLEEDEIKTVLASVAVEQDDA
jgi:hypothetical protein